MKLSIYRLNEVLNYNSNTGIFTWNINKYRAKKGDIAGTRHGGGYVVIKIDGESVLAHRLAWFYTYGEWPKYEIDHINGIRNDNRIANLRDVEKNINMQNQVKAHKGSKTGLIGACREKSGRFQSKIYINGKYVWIGIFNTALEAHEAYMITKRKLHEGCTI